MKRRKALKINNCVEDKNIQLNMTNLTLRQETSISNTEHNKLIPVKKFNSYKDNQKVQTVQTFHSKKK